MSEYISATQSNARPLSGFNPVWSRLVEIKGSDSPTQYDYDVISGSLSCSRKYFVVGCEMSEVYSLKNLPITERTWTAWTPPVNIGSEGATPKQVTMRLSRISGVRVTPNTLISGSTYGPAVECELHYEGHRDGYLRTESETGKRSVTLKIDMNGRGIGANNEGAAKELPVTTVVVFENVTDPNISDSYLYDCQKILTSCNESGWDVDMTVTFPFVGSNGFTEAYWRYDAIIPRKNQNGSYTFEHKFINDTYVGRVETRDMSQFSWWKTVRITDSSINATSHLEAIQPEQKALIYPVAGKTYNGDTVPRWQSTFRWSKNYNGVYTVEG